MGSSPVIQFPDAMQALSPLADDYVPKVVQLLLDQARQHHASDIHLIPEQDTLRMQWRLDGVLQTVAVFDGDLKSRLIARLKVLCGLLTYRTDIPQEGRVSREFASTEIRVTTFPTLFGEKAAVRLFAGNDRLQHLQQLGFSPEIEATLREQLEASDGVILLTGPSGSGKTTTAYACLRDLVAMSAGARSVMTLEDPVEVAVSGITQSQVRPSAGFDLTMGLRSLMRQDPDVIMVGEIRDSQTAEVVFQAALTGHLVLTTFHAGSGVEAITRLLEMGIEPYILRSSLRAVVSQRLVRQLVGRSSDGGILPQAEKSQRPRISSDNSPGQPSLSIQERNTQGSQEGARYSGRMILAELLDPQRPELAQAILQRADARQLARIVRDCGCRTLRDAAQEAVLAGRTSAEEVFRVLGRPHQPDSATP